MAAHAAFISGVNLGAALLGTAETSLTVPAQSSVIVTAGASGTQIDEVRIFAATTSLTPTTVAGLVYLFAYDGTTYNLVDTIPVTAVTASATVAPFSVNRYYPNLRLKSGWFLRASQSIAGNASLLKCSAFGGDY